MLIPINNYILTEKVKYHTLSNIITVVGEKKSYVHKDVRIVALPENGIRFGDGYITPSVKVGDIVLLEKVAGLTQFYEGKEYLLIKEDDIIGIYEDYYSTKFSVGSNKTDETLMIKEEY